jgi:hypothetical protein
MIRDGVHEVRKSEISDPVYVKNKPSFLECDSGRLWVGTFYASKGTQEGYANGYAILDSEEGCRLNTTMYQVITGIDSSAQGMDIDGNYLYVSSSYKGYVAAVKSSFITKYEISPLHKGYNSVYAADRELTRIEVPKMNEEILVDSRNIYINFEAAADKWKFCIIPTDRILSVRKSLWDQ